MCRLDFSSVQSWTNVPTHSLLWKKSALEGRKKGKATKFLRGHRNNTQSRRSSHGDKSAGLVYNEEDGESERKREGRRGT